MRTVRIGLCGFTIAIAEYPRWFPVVEVQQTFYEPPGDDVLQRWLSVTPSSLEYTMKVWQLVTHPIASPTYRRMKRPPDPASEPGFFRASAAVRTFSGCMGHSLYMTSQRGRGRPRP